MNKRYNITITILLFVAVILISSLNTPEKDYHEEIKDKGVSSVSYTKAKCYKNNDNCTLLLPSFIINDSYKLDGIFLNKERVEKNSIELNKDSILEIRTVKISKI